MARNWTRRQALAAGVAVCAGAPLIAAPEKAIKLETYTGKVQPLADLVAKIGSKLDGDAAPHWLALVAEDGKVYPLIKDTGARMFFVDKRLLNRPMRLTGRLLPGAQLLQVLEVNSLIKGVPHDVYYWCDICTIRRNEKMICECCGAMMDLKEVPLKK
jgi:hypothetical protein